MSQHKELSSRIGIKEFYAGKDVMVTGATGFMGKVLVEKLVRSIPEIGNVYILVREKRGKTSKERLDNLLSSRVSKVTLLLLGCGWRQNIIIIRVV